MKNKIFTLLLSFSAACLAVQNDGDQLALTLAQAGTELYAAHQNYQKSLPNEKNFRKRVYWLDKNNPNWYMLDDFRKDFDYHIANLIGHIKVLEDKIAQKKSGLRSAALTRAAITSALSALCGYSTYLCHNYRKLAKYDSSLGSFCQAMGSQNMMNATLSFGFLSAVLAIVAVQNFDKAYRYAERMLERLERDKRILELLQKEKAAKNDETSKVSEAALQLINNLISVVTNFSQPTVVATAVANDNSSQEINA